MFKSNGQAKQPPKRGRGRPPGSRNRRSRELMLEAEQGGEPSRGSARGDAAPVGFLLAARSNGATPNLGLGMLFEAFAAVVIGGVSLRGGIGRLSGVFAGGLMLLAVLLDSLKTQVRRRYL